MCFYLILFRLCSQGVRYISTPLFSDQHSILLSNHRDIWVRDKDLLSACYQLVRCITLVDKYSHYIWPSADARMNICIYSVRYRSNRESPSHQLSGANETQEGILMICREVNIGCLYPWRSKAMILGPKTPNLYFRVRRTLQPNRLCGLHKRRRTFHLIPYRYILPIFVLW